MKDIDFLKDLNLEKEIFIWAFFSSCCSSETNFNNEEIDPIYFQKELTEVFSELDLAWKLQLITFENMNTVIEEVAASQDRYFPVVLNYCSGLDEIDGYPGASVAKLLEAKGIVFTGADSQFFKMGDSKILMKQAFVKSGVSTAPYEVIKDVNSIQGLCDRLVPPLIVKLSASCSSVGISLKSVVHTDEDAIPRFEELQQGQHGIQIPSDSIFVEEFIKGREFTALVIGNAQKPEEINIYPALEIVFHSDVPETEQFYTRELLLGEAEERTILPHQESLFSYQLASIELWERLSELAKRAYCAIGATGYGRVDIRMEETTQKIFVLEVNPCPFVTSTSLAKGIEYHKSSKIGTILHLAGIPFRQLISEIITEALTRYSDKIPAIDYKSKTRREA